MLVQKCKRYHNKVYTFFWSWVYNSLLCVYTLKNIVQTLLESLAYNTCTISKTKNLKTHEINKMNDVTLYNCNIVAMTSLKSAAVRFEIQCVKPDYWGWALQGVVCNNHFFLKRFLELFLNYKDYIYCSCWTWTLMGPRKPWNFVRF